MREHIQSTPNQFLLIEPEGIEMQTDAVVRINGTKLLIEPEGIEIFVNPIAALSKYLLIEPEGIETD